MKHFQLLGDQIEKIWRDCNYDEDDFPLIAERGLKEAGLPGKVSAWEVIEWTLDQTNLPEQKDLGARFGDPPITIYNAPRFHIDVYFWLEGTTSIHQHGFCGAFQVLHGSSLHSWYEFEKRRTINSFMEIGDISLKVCELLSVGDIQKILPGRQYIHGLFHLDQPSATIVVRTHKSALYLPQFAYYKPSVALDPFFEEANTLKKIQAITALFRSKYPETDKLVAGMLEKSDFQSTFSILSTVRQYLGQSHLDRMFDLSSPKERFKAFLDIARRRHGDAADVFPEVFAEMEIVEEIVRRRSVITDPEHRFFLALLMSVDGRQRILSLVKERFPDKDPVDKILDWTFDLSETKVLGLNIQNALGIDDFGELDLFVLEGILRGRPSDDLQTAFETEYPNDVYAEIAPRLVEKKQGIQNSVLFRSLLKEELLQDTA